MIRFFLKKHWRSAPLLSAEEFHGPISAFMDRHLAELGFVRPRQGVWVREHCGAGRPMFELRHYKGAVSAAEWGLALNYVPHFNNAFTKLSWHRTVKSARMDVFPFDDIAKTPGLSRFAAPEDHATTVETVLGSALERGQRFFERHRHLDDLLPLFERLRRHRGDGLGYWNYMSLPVAHAFTLRVLGDRAGGEHILGKYVERHGISGAAWSDLTERFERARVSGNLV